MIDIFDRFEKTERRVILIAAAFVALLTPFCDTVYLPALTDVGSNLNASTSQVLRWICLHAICCIFMFPGDYRYCNIYINVLKASSSILYIYNINMYVCLYEFSTVSSPNCITYVIKQLRFTQTSFINLSEFCRILINYNNFVTQKI